MEKLEDTKKYKRLTINNISFSNVQIFIKRNYIEIVNYIYGCTIANINKDDIKTVEIN